MTIFVKKFLSKAKTGKSNAGRPLKAKVKAFSSPKIGACLKKSIWDHCLIRLFHRRIQSLKKQNISKRANTKHAEKRQAEERKRKEE
jgi:hypothetical protein